MFLKYRRNLLLKFVKFLLFYYYFILLFLLIKESSEKFLKSCCHEINKKDETMAKCILSLSKMCLKLGKYTLTVKLNNSGAQQDLSLFIETT